MMAEKIKLKNLEIPYRDSIKSTATTLKETSISIENVYEFDLDKLEISEAILERLKTFYKTQQEIKRFLNKRYQTPGADFFVETIVFYIKAYLKQLQSPLEVHSERQIKNKRGMIRPDISIWKEGCVIAIIECKTQLGWNRNNWEKDFIIREEKLRKEFPKAEAFLLVMSGQNWSGFGNSKYLGQKYFCLLDEIRPIQFQDESQIMTPFEGLLSFIITLNPK